MKDVASSRVVDDQPLRVSVINTASQPMARSGVLDAERDPDSAQPYVMSHPSFVLEWADGRILLIDTGMTPEQATAFGKPIQMIRDAQPIEPHQSTADALRSVQFQKLRSEGSMLPIIMLTTPAASPRSARAPTTTSRCS